MSANLIVYSMAARAERPELERRAARARLVAEAAGRTPAQPNPGRDAAGVLGGWATERRSGRAASATRPAGRGGRSAGRVARLAVGLVVALALLAGSVTIAGAEAPTYDKIADARAITTLPYAHSVGTREATAAEPNGIIPGERPSEGRQR